ncbi:hypothetical protein [Salmonella enterica]|uniref:hypothetical protein n=1 Tax=Salmonella enterica TaxID=28901 RepID=UPI0015940627|nr:hypothetical protein [Salmonella enterica]
MPSEYDEQRDATDTQLPGEYDLFDLMAKVRREPARPGGFWAACRPGSVIAFSLTRVRVIRRYYILFLYFHVITGGCNTLRIT